MKSQTFKTITGVIAVLGVIGSIVSGFVFKTVDFSLDTGVAEKFNTQLMFEGLIGTVLICLVFYGFATVIEHLEKLENVNNKMTDTIKSSVEEKREPSKSEWKCPNCGKINQNYVGSCGCGTTRP